MQAGCLKEMTIVYTENQSKNMSNLDHAGHDYR